jgi:hypothetical protein
VLALAIISYSGSEAFEVIMELHQEQALSNLLAIEFLRCLGRRIQVAQQFADTEFNFFGPSRLGYGSHLTGGL